MVESSYFDAERSGLSRCCGTNAPSSDTAPKTSSELRVPTTTAGTIYAGWDQLNVDGVDRGHDGDLNDDAPWDFGSVFDYPVLVFGGATDTEAARRTLQREAQPAVSLAPTLAGSETVSEGGTASYVVRLPQALPPGVSVRWDWSVGGGEADADDFVGVTASSVAIVSGAVSASFSVGVFDDDAPEFSEVLVVTLTGARLTGAPARGVDLGMPVSVRTIIEASDETIYNGDGDTLIDVETTSQLSAIRYDLGGVGPAGVSSANKAAYYAAFPFFDEKRTCPSTCTGYELSNDLDLSDVADWTPIGGGSGVEYPVDYYTAVFEGNGRVISNLTMTGDGQRYHVGLFGAVSAVGTIRNVGLRNARVVLGRSSTYTGALVGRNEGKVAASLRQWRSHIRRIRGGRFDRGSLRQFGRELRRRGGACGGKQRGRSGGRSRRRVGGQRQLLGRGNDGDGHGRRSDRQPGSRRRGGVELF